MPKQTEHFLTKQSTLTIIMCALACEAKPFIDFFKLKKNTAIHPFSVYQLGSVIVMVSGLGQNNMSAAVNWLSGYINAKQTQFWINVGVAGHQSADIGSLFCTHKISDSQQSVYPTKWLKHKISLDHLITINHEETDYQDNVLYDMEGFAFYQAATRFNSQECVQCLKVVSDNLNQSINRDKAFVSDLIEKQRDQILSFIEIHAQALAKLYTDSSQFESLQNELLSNIHFSHSQQLQLSKLCQSAQSHQINLDTLELNDVTQSKQVLALIKNHIDQQAVTL